MRRYTIGEIAAALGAEALGERDLEVARPAEPAAAGPDDLAMAMEPHYAEGLARGAARAALLWEGADWKALGLEAAIAVARPRMALAGVTRLMDPGPDLPDGIHATAVIDPSAEIGPGARIGPFVVVGGGVRIGPGACIGSHASLAAGAVLGAEVRLGEGVRIGRRVTIGDRFIAQPNAVVGADGFSFVTPEKSSVERARETLGDQGEIAHQPWVRIHSLGSVVIGDDVELGAGSCIDAGTIRPTRVGNGTKFDNLVMIGHNVEIGDDCLFAGNSGVAGSTRVGNRVVFGGKVGAADNIFIGDDVIAGGGSKIVSNVPAGRVIMGYPAQKMDGFVETTKQLRRLPRLAEQVRALQKAVSNRDPSG